MNQIKLLKLKVKHSSMILDQKRMLYYQSKGAMRLDNNKWVPLFCMGAFGTTFTWAFLGGFRKQIFKVGKNIAKIGLKRFLL